MDEQRKVVWNADAVETFGKALNWIGTESIQQADQVKEGIFERLIQASKNPFRFPPDQYKTGNTGNFRCIVSHSYRISYKISDTQIRVLRLRHVKQKPKYY